MLLDLKQESRTKSELARNARKRKTKDRGGPRPSAYISLEHALRGYPADYLVPEQLCMLRRMLGV